MLQVIQYPIHLIHLPLGVLVLHRQLVAVGLADGAVFIGPAVPDVAPQVVDIVGLLLPDPQQLVDAGLEKGAAHGKDGKLLAQVVAVDDAELLYSVGGRAVLPVGTHLLVGVPHPVSQDVTAIFLKDLVCTAHKRTPCVFFLIVPDSPAIGNTNVRDKKKEIVSCRYFGYTVCWLKM